MKRDPEMVAWDLAAGLLARVRHWLGQWLLLDPNWGRPDPVDLDRLLFVLGKDKEVDLIVTP